jgi:hypothetical protein
VEGAVRCRKVILAVSADYGGSKPSRCFNNATLFWASLSDFVETQGNAANTFRKSIQGKGDSLAGVGFEGL